MDRTTENTTEKLTRREVLVGSIAAGAVTVAGRAEEPHAASGDFAAGAKVFAVHDQTATKMPNGSERKVILSGTLATGEKLRMHESLSPAGTPAPEAHVITHSELIVVLEGVLELEHDGKRDRAVAGDVIYVAYGTNHAIKNMGDGPARYKVLSMGGDVKLG